jgi:hypothetical protein
MARSYSPHMRTPRGPGSRLAGLALSLAVALVGGSACESDGGRTRCGQDADCDPVSEICVRHQLGVRVVHECVDLPDGCGEERTCSACDAVCEEPADTCADSDADNTVVCSCIECRAALAPALTD